MCREEAQDLVTKYNSGYFDVPDPNAGNSLTSSQSVAPDGGGGGGGGGGEASQVLLRPRLFGVIKEVAPIKGVATDLELGVEEFQSKYFGDYPVYLDESKNFYALLGNRGLLSQSWSSWNPFNWYASFKALKARLSGMLMKFYLLCNINTLSFKFGFH